jgi:parvulin-like peptidyl-prolyl isomerase
MLNPTLIHAKILDKIVAVVNDEVITQSEIDALLYPLYVQFSRIYKTEQEVYENLDKSRLDILRQLIHDKLLLGQAKKLEITVSETEVDQRIDMVKEDIKSKGGSFEDLLREQKMTLGELRKKYRDMLMIEKVIDRQVRRFINIQPSEVNSYYRENIGDYTQTEKVAVYGILIKTESVRTPQESRQLAEDVHMGARKGANFNELAANYSEDAHKNQGGDFGYVKRGQLLKEIEDEIFSLAEGEISDIVKTPLGYYIFKVYDKHEARTIPLEEVYEKVQMTLYRAKMQEKFEEWLEDLNKNAYISIK